MKKHPNITIAIVLILSIAAGTIQGHRLDRLFEIEAFMRWLAAVATDERLGLEQESEDGITYDDLELYQEVVAATEDKLASALYGDDEDAVIPEGSALSAALEDAVYDWDVFRVAKSAEIAPLRDEFLEKLRDGRLQYTQDLSYAAVMSGLEGQGSVSVFNLFFGFRKVAANFIWLEVDRFFHAGLLHRMIPLMKTCVLLDPGFVDAYLLGAWHMGYNVTATMEPTPFPMRTWSDKYQDCLGDQQTYYYFAVDFLKDGIRNNPRNYKLYFDLGYAIYRDKLKDTENAVRYLTHAVRLPHERWVPRTLYICLEENGDYDLALQGWYQNLERFPDHPVSLRFVQRLKGLIAERNSEDARNLAKATTDPAERERLMAECRAYQAEARAIWEGMGAEEGYAIARLLRLDAIDRAESGYYLEAVSLLDKGRFEVGSVFDEFSNLIIEFKQAGSLPLSLSESKQLIREEESVACEGMPESERLRRIEELKKKRTPLL